MTGIKRVLETGETPAKLQKLDPQLLKDLLAQQKEIFGLENQCSDEQQTLVQTFDVKKQPILAKRNAVLKKIPNFWRVVFQNIPSVPEADLLDIKEEELAILDYLDEVKVEENCCVEKRKHIFSFTFKENPFFNETAFKKEVMDAEEENQLSMTVPEITWKGEANPLDKAYDDESSGMSFFMWLTSEHSVEGDFGHIFRELVWGNPMAVYNQEHEEEDDSEE